MTPAQASALRSEHGLTIQYGAQVCYIGTVQEPLDSRSMIDIATRLTSRAVAAIEAAQQVKPVRNPGGDLATRIAEHYLMRSFFTPDYAKT